MIEEFLEELFSTNKPLVEFDSTNRNIIPEPSNQEMLFLTVLAEYFFHTSLAKENYKISDKIEFMIEEWGIDYDVNIEIEEEIYEVVITDGFPDTRILISWIRAFWEFGFNILDNLHMVLSYTQDFFTRDNVTEAIKWVEETQHIRDKKLTKEWEFLLKAN